MAQMPEPLTEMPLNPTPQQAGIATRRVPKEIPDMDDPFCDPNSGLKWAELVIEQPALLEEQRVVDFTKPFWHYLGELSTEYISKYSEDPQRRIPNEAANLIPSRKSKPKRQSLQQPKAMFNAHMQQNGGYLGYSQAVLQHQQQHQQLQQQHHQIQQQRAAYNQQQMQSKGQGYHDPGYHAPVAPMMGQMPQQQLWPPIYRPSAGGPGMQQGAQQPHTMHGGGTMHVSPAAAGQFVGTIDQRRVEYVAAAALSVSPHHVHQLSMENATNPSQETGVNIKSAATSPVTLQGANLPQSKSSKVVINVPAPAMPTTPFRSNGKGSFSSPPQIFTPTSASTPQAQSSPSEQLNPQAKSTPTKVVPLADIQAALARLAKAKTEAEAELRERLQAQAQAAQAHVITGLAPPSPQAA